MPLLSNVASMAVASILLVSGLIHAAQPYYFVHSIASYRLLPTFASGVLGLWLPYLQIVLALCIGLRIAEKAALYMAAFVFATFALAQITVIIRGMAIDCGCFGFVARAVSPTSTALPLLLAGACVFAIVSKRRLQAGSLQSAQ